MSGPPDVGEAPGLVWKPRSVGWEARWQARTDLVRKGFTPKSVRLWKGEVPTELERQWISDRCKALQSEMLVFGRGGIAVITTFDGKLSTLIRNYEMDQDSPYRKLRYKTKENYASLTGRILADHSDVEVKDIKARTLLRWHEDWCADGHVSMAHSLIGMLRGLLSFGGTILEDAECSRVRGLLRDMKFKMGSARLSRLTAEQATAIREAARKMGYPSMALAQALQFEGMLRQKDVIGEWVPTSEPVPSDLIHGNSKWARGLRWNEIDEHLVLRHITSKKQKPHEVDLKLAPMVLEEFSRLPKVLPTSGPVIVCEWTELPYDSHQFRRLWRQIARKVGIPDHVRNMDSRAGAITEATDAGAPLEAVRHAATHGDISMTQRYSRGAAEKTAEVMRLRTAYRSGNVSGTTDPERKTKE